MEIMLEGSDWQTEADFIEGVLSAVRAPTGHGRNYNALRDSFVVGEINGIEPPYDFIIRMPTSPTSEVEDAVRYFVDRVSEWRAEGASLSARLA